MSSTNRTTQQELGRAWALQSWGECTSTTPVPSLSGPTGLLPFLPPLRVAHGSLYIANLGPFSSEPTLVIPTVFAHDHCSFL